MSVTDLNQTVSYIWHVVDVCSKLHKDFHDYCLCNMSNQLVTGIVFSCFCLKNYKKHTFALQYDHSAILLRRRVNQLTKMTGTHSNKVYLTVRYQNNFAKVHR